MFTCSHVHQVMEHVKMFVETCVHLERDADVDCSQQRCGFRCGHGQGTCGGASQPMLVVTPPVQTCWLLRTLASRSAPWQ